MQAQRVQVHTEFSELITVAFLLTFALSSLNANFFVVFLKGCKIFTCFTEFTFFHTLSYIPMHECTLAVHEIKLVVNAREHFCNGGGIADHATCTHNLCQVTARDDCGGLIVDAALEACWRPVHKLYGTLCLDSRNRCVDILRHDISAVHHAACHVLAMTRIALHKHGCRLEHRHCNFCHRELFVISLFGGDDGSMRRKHEVDSRVGHKICLEFSNVDI